jgi:RNA polymerase sigma-70 factor (ECF subfamily)
MSSVPHPDAALVARCRGGDDGAWAELIERYGKKVYAIAYHMVYDRSEAEELTQDCFLKIWENLDRYEPSEASLLAWMAALSRNLCIDHYRKRRREKGYHFVSDDAVASLLPSSDDPEGDSVKRERLRLLLDAIAELPDELAQVVMLRDLPGGTVKSRLNRARIELARIVRSRIRKDSGGGGSVFAPFFRTASPAAGGAR